MARKVKRRCPICREPMVREKPENIGVVFEGVEDSGRSGFARSVSPWLREGSSHNRRFCIND